MPKPVRIGGSFAPPLTEDRLASYEITINGVEDNAVKEAMLEMQRCVRRWWELPLSSGVGSFEHPLQIATVVPLDQPIADNLDPLIPWPHQLDATQALFDKLPEGTVRNVAFHLLWFVKELDMGREPITSDLIRIPAKS